MNLELTTTELKLLRLIFNSGAATGEAETARQKLVSSLEQRGVSGHDLVETLESAGDGGGEVLPPKMWKPDYGLCVMPFGKTRGQRFMDLSPYDLRSARRWAQHTPELAQKFAEFIHDVDEFLKQ